MFEKHFSRDYEMIGFPHFVPKDELGYNLDWARQLVDEQWVFYRWREDVERGGWKRFEQEAKRIASHGGLILEICAGPGGGFAPATLMQDYNANIMISDLCPTVVSEWKKHFEKMDNPPPNIEYAAFNVCDMPFRDDSIDVVSGRAAIINVEGSRDKALREIYRILKPGGPFVFDFIFVTEEFYNQMQPQIQKAIKNRYPMIFWDTLHTFDELGFSKVETIATGTWSNENDESGLADFCRSLNTSLTFSGFSRFCIK
ncbi:MAG: class I SAM-dependent methyltransferase [Oscillospiraceae bacterium]|nr:class I SAM-dependent methyltransferase [Oscillospiraceae bacterium]